MEVRWCQHQNKKCDYCNFIDKRKCNYEEREGTSYLDCQCGVKPKGNFQVVCGFCGSNDVDTEIIYYPDDNYSEIKYTCNNCGNQNK
jgi:guanyl-specific ribonuclease Sa